MAGFSTHIAAALFGLALATAPAAAVTVRLSYHYYRLSAGTIEELRAAMQQNGPYLAATGRHHAAAALIVFQSAVKQEAAAGHCRIKQADITVNARIYLPQWQRQTRPAAGNVTLFQDMLLRDIKRHEHNHIVIARHYGSEMERELRSLPYQRRCRQVEREAETVLRRLEQKSEAAQRQFDAVEGKNFDRRLRRLIQEAGREKAAPADTKLRGHP